MTHPTATRDEWRAQRIDLLAREKELTRLRDELSAARRAMPWVPIDQAYRFESETGSKSLADLFDGRSQLVVYHFKFGPDWGEGCPSCSFWADSFDGIGVHLAHRDTTFVAVSEAPLSKLLAYRQCMGWSFPWVSSGGSDFNYDFGVSFTPEQQASSGDYNFRTVERPGEQSPGMSAFVIERGDVHHTYSCYARGLDVFNTAYQLLDITAKGRDEDGLEWPMAWLRRHDSYDA